MNDNSAHSHQYDHMFKIVLIGDSGVGKSQIFSRYTSDSFIDDSKATIGVEMATKSVKKDGKIIKSQIWDTAGQERFRAVTNAYYRGAAGACVVFDITSRKSFENVNMCLQEIKESAAENELVIMLVGNKSDLQDCREVTQEQAADYASKKQIAYIETSAKDGNNIDLAFDSLINEIYSLLKVAGVLG